MTTTVRTVAGLTIASAAVTVALVTPATTVAMPPIVGHGVVTNNHLPPHRFDSLPTARVAEHQ